jgi:hypothetical protein
MFAGYAADKRRKGSEVLYDRTQISAPQGAGSPAGLEAFEGDRHPGNEQTGTGTSRFRLGAGLGGYTFRSNEVDATALAPTLTFAVLLTDNLSFQLEAARPRSDLTTVRAVKKSITRDQTETAELQVGREVQYSLSTLLALHARPTQRMGVEMLAGVTFERQRETVSGPFTFIVRSVAEVGRYGPGSYYIGSDGSVLAFTLGLNLPVRVARRVEIVPQLRLDCPGCTSKKAVDKITTFRPSMGVRWLF